MNSDTHYLIKVAIYRMLPTSVPEMMDELTKYYAVDDINFAYWQLLGESIIRREGNYLKHGPGEFVMYYGTTTSIRW